MDVLCVCVKWFGNNQWNEYARNQHSLWDCSMGIPLLSQHKHKRSGFLGWERTHTLTHPLEDPKFNPIRIGCFCYCFAIGANTSLEQTAQNGPPQQRIVCLCVMHTKWTHENYRCCFLFFLSSVVASLSLSGLMFGWSINTGVTTHIFPLGDLLWILCMRFAIRI